MDVCSVDLFLISLLSAVDVPPSQVSALRLEMRPPLLASGREGPGRGLRPRRHRPGRGGDGVRRGRRRTRGCGDGGRRHGPRMDGLRRQGAKGEGLLEKVRPRSRVVLAFRDTAEDHSASSVAKKRKKNLLL